MRRSRDYLRKICAVALCANANIKFAAVLVVAEWKSNTKRLGKTVTNMNYLFHQNFILPSLQEKYERNLKVMGDEYGTELDFKTVHVNSNTEVAITPLVEIKGLYLCVYFDQLARPLKK